NCGGEDEVETNHNDVLTAKPMKWLKSVQDIFSSPTGHVVVQVAKELINRSAGNSQVLSLNLTNLLIILLLKILIFSAGLLGAGHWSNYGYARSDDNVSKFTVNEGEAYLIIGFLAAQAGFDGCLYAAACETPAVAYEYSKAAKALLDGISKYEGSEYENKRFTDLIILIEEATLDGYRGIPCNTSIKCSGLL
ncbi:hypothetical protein DOY81_003262, partial [Sarcophaga bullata]